LGDERIPKVAQNFPFDSYVLAKEFGFDIRHLYMDTMVAHHAAYCELPKGLDFLTSIYTRTPYYSDYDASVDLDLWRYNCYDAAVTLEISYRLDEELASLGISEFYHNHLNPCIPALTRTQNRGVKVDVPLRTTMTETAKRERDELGITLGKLTGLGDFNPRSYKQKLDLLYDKMGLPKQYAFKNGERRVTTDKKALEVLIRKVPTSAPTVRAIIDYQERATLISSFLEKELDGEQRIRTSYNLAGTVTGRLSSSEPLWDAGTNLQNIPIRTEPGRLFRRLFVADDGWSLVKADLSQAEFRLVVWMARIHRIIERYASDRDFDVHRWVASLIYKIPENEVVKTQRDIAKNGVYGGNYRMSYAKAALTYKLDIPTARFVLDSYRDAIPEIPEWWNTVERVLIQSRVLVSPMGRRRVFFDRLDDELFRAAYSHSAQCIVGDIINRALTLACEIFDDKECFPVLQVHDEIVFACRTELVPVYAPRIRNLMEYPLTFDGVKEPLIIPADISHGKNWLDQEKISFTKE
jgi:DNA polymerase-1